MLRVEINKTEEDKKGLTFPILVQHGDGNIFIVNETTNGRMSPRIDKETTNGVDYTHMQFDLSKPFPQHGYDLFKGSITLTQE